MHLKSHAFGMASGLVTLVCYVVGAIPFVLAPQETVKFLNYTNFNIDLTPIMGAGLTWGSFFAGLVFSIVLMYVFGALFAWCYNKFAK